MVIYGDLNETFQAGMVYVILSRIVSISQLYLMKFDEDKIYCNERAKAEALRIKKLAINKLTTSWDLNENNQVKICSLNVRSLEKHYEDIENDVFLNKSQILFISETWLTSDLTEKFPEYFPRNIFQL